MSYMSEEYKDIILEEYDELYPDPYDDLTDEEFLDDLDRRLFDPVEMDKDMYWASHYERINQPDEPLLHPDFQPGDTVGVNFLGTKGNAVIKKRLLYCNPAGRGPANSAIYEIEINGETKNFNGTLLSPILQAEE